MFADVSSFGVELQWVIAIVLTVVLALLVFRLISFCCCNGPYHSGYFEEGRALSSCFGQPRASENFRNLCEYKPLNKDTGNKYKNFSGGYNEDIRDFYELQRISRKARLGNWNDFTPLSMSAAVSDWFTSAPIKNRHP